MSPFGDWWNAIWICSALVRQISDGHSAGQSPTYVVGPPKQAGLLLSFFARSLDPGVSDLQHISRKTCDAQDTN